MNDQVKPGKLGTPAMTLATDPRLDPRLAPLIAMMPGLAGSSSAPQLGASIDETLAYCDAVEEAGRAANADMAAGLPEFPSVVSTTETIQGVDGNDITLFVHQPVERRSALPCVVHLHGGGMVVMSAEDPGFVLLRQSLAAMGMVVIGVEFRNGGGRLGPHPFPAGLNDCTSAVKWANDQRNALNIASIIVAGESGGGNLSLATTLKAKQDGHLDCIDGVYGMCPYISGAYGEPTQDLPSLLENDGYILDGAMMAAMVTTYDPQAAHRTNPLTWPYYASSADLQGLPPHVIAVNELDPLRDEGLAYYRKLLAAGVPTIGKTIHGTPHAGDQLFGAVIPDVFADTLRSIYGFATSL